jgi:uncharacterized protein (TIGR03084 family)
MSAVTDVIADLAAEHADLDVLLVDGAVEQPTPAEGWTIADCLAHLWHFDGRAMLAVSDPDRFTAELAKEAELVPESHRQAHAMGGAALHAAWRERAAQMVDAFRAADPSARVPWYGPPMSLMSFVTARLMETWAHGQDIVDALLVERTSTDRLRHVAHLGVRARPFSYTANGLTPPESKVGVSLVGPGGENWTWDEDASESVTGSALDFCLVVTQRRHLDDTDLSMSGPSASEWMSMAQCFAGPPGAGRQPGQFS